MHGWMLSPVILNYTVNILWVQPKCMQRVFDADNCIYIVMEFVAGGNLGQYLDANRSNFTEDDARWFFQQLVIALDYCHRKKGICNRDIKLENSLLTQPKVRKA